jgi:hypothetical protein
MNNEWLIHFFGGMSAGVILGLVIVTIVEALI